MECWPVGRNVISSYLPGPAASPPPAPILTHPEPLQADAEQKPTGTGLRSSDDCPLRVAEPCPLTSILSGAPGWGRPLEGDRGQSPPCQVPPHQAVPGPSEDFSGPSRAHSWASVVHRVESLGYSFKNKLCFLFLKVYKNHFT